MEQNYKIYKLTFPDNKVYIGQTKRNPEDRWMKGAGYKKQEKVYQAILKFGWDNIKKQILYQHLNKSQADQKEKEEIIKAYKNNMCYNTVCNKEQLCAEEYLKQRLRITEEQIKNNQKVRVALSKYLQGYQLIHQLGRYQGTATSKVRAWINGTITENQLTTYQEERIRQLIKKNKTFWENIEI